MQKIWGHSIREHINDCLQVEKISVVKGGYSSVHLHEKKHNAFLVTSGMLDVRLFPDGPHKLAQVVTLESGGVVHVSPEVCHQFFAHTDVEAYEVYWVDGSGIDPNDIVRFSENGVKDFDVDHVKSTEYHCCKCNTGLGNKESFVVVWEGARRDMCKACQAETEAEVVANGNGNSKDNGR